jgi:oxygen-independent coproporphyrinogen-3 oxidase
MGMTAIGMVGDCYSQNQKTMDDYFAALDTGHLPVMRGITLDADDKLRRAIITQLICHFALDYDTVEGIHGIRFADYFGQELNDLRVMQQDGLLELNATSIRVLPAGKLLIRNICMVFDRYLRQKESQRFSKVI